MSTPFRFNSLVLRKFKMIEKYFGSRSINKAPVSSRHEGMRPLKIIFRVKVFKTKVFYLKLNTLKAMKKKNLELSIMFDVKLKI
jgi:hypothetical protein